WKDLIHRLAEELNVPPDFRGQDIDYYLDLAEYYRVKRSPQELSRIIREQFGHANTTPKPTLAHYLLLALPVRYIVTTNYDGLLEQALTALRRHPVKVVRQEEVANTGRQDGIYVIKFHGDADDQIQDESGAGIVLSRSDYDAFFQQRPVMAALLEGLLLN